MLLVRQEARGENERRYKGVTREKSVKGTGN